MLERKQRLDLVTKNWSAILEAMKRLGATGADIEYRGCGDSGEGTEVTFQPASVDGSTLVEIYRIHSEFQNGAWSRTEVGSQTSLEEALRWLTDEVVSLAGHDGYENNEGGYGKLTVLVEEGSFALEHSDYVVETLDSTHSMEELMGDVDETPSLPPSVLLALGAPQEGAGV